MTKAFLLVSDNTNKGNIVICITSSEYRLLPIFPFSACFQENRSKTEKQGG